MQAQSPMISAPLKATGNIDWEPPLKQYIRQTYGDDPERYAKECKKLNDMRQDITGAKGDDVGPKLLYTYYGQLEMLDLRFPVDENHIKISFTWFNAFTDAITSQYSLAYEKASVMFNISAALSCHAARQNLSEEFGLKTAYRDFQASAGMFTYINDNFLHAPSTDLSRETIKTLIQIMLAQGQEVVLEKQILFPSDKNETKERKEMSARLLPKLASQASYLYSQAVEGIQKNVEEMAKKIKEKKVDPSEDHFVKVMNVWLPVVQVKANYMSSLAQYYQALADDGYALSHGVAISRLHAAEITAKEANKIASSFHSSVPKNSNLSSETRSALIDITQRQLTKVQEKLSELTKDNDYIYHQNVPAEATLPVIPKAPAAKAMTINEFYTVQEMNEFTNLDIFQSIVPLSVTNSSSKYDEKKAELVRAETERVETANSEMAASLDYLRLPGALQVLKGGFDQELAVDDEFKGWCDDVAGNESPPSTFVFLNSSKERIIEVLDRSSRQLDMEESVCEKMRSKYEGEWTQLPSARLTTTLRNDIRNYREALEEAARSDNQLYSKMRQHEVDFDEMRSAGEIGEADVLYQKALIQVGGKRGNIGTPMNREGNLLDDDFDNGAPSVADQIAKIEEVLKQLNLIKRDRAQVLKDLKEKVHNDDISKILILNKKSISMYENQLFDAELEKYRPHQDRLHKANHKQASLMKDLTSTFNTLLQDKRVRAEQSKYESITRQRSAVMSKYKKIHQEFLDLEAGLQAAKDWYSEMRDTVESLDKNVETFVNNRRSEGAQLLGHIEQGRTNNASGQADRERERLRGLMERMSMDAPTSPPPTTQPLQTQSVSYNSTSPSTGYPQTNFAGQYQVPPSSPPKQISYQQYPQQNNGGYYPPQQPRQDYISTQKPTPPPLHGSYNPGTYPPVSPPPTQTQFSQNQQVYSRTPMQASQYVPHGYVPPPPPPGPPPLGPQQTFPQPPGHEGYDYKAQNLQQQQQQGRGHQPQSGDPWAGLNAWK